MCFRCDQIFRTAAGSRAAQRIDRIRTPWPPKTLNRASKHRASKPPRHLVVAHRRRRARTLRRSRT